MSPRYCSCTGLNNQAIREYKIYLMILIATRKGTKFGTKIPRIPIDDCGSSDASGEGKLLDKLPYLIENLGVLTYAGIVD